MRCSTPPRLLRPAALSFALVLLLFASAPALAGEYPALEGVKQLKTVFDYGNGSAQEAVVVFPAIRDVYQSRSVTALPEAPATVIVFHNQAVKLLSTARTGDAKENAARDKVAEMIRRFKKDGVRMEVCMYAVKALGVDPATLMPEIDQVPNGFVSVAGYQAQGYAVVAVP